MIALTADDVFEAVGLPPASTTDEVWAERCAKAANAFVNRLPAIGYANPDDVDLGARMLASNMYRRRPAGTLGPDADPGAAAAVDGTISRLLGLGYYQRPVIA